jgi:hypothetical protein
MAGVFLAGWIGAMARAGRYLAGMSKEEIR